MDKLRESLHQNNYPKSTTLARRKLDCKTEDKTRKLTAICLPYVKGLTAKIPKIFRPYDIRKTFRSGSTLRKHLYKSNTQQNT